ncbi:antibiotic efflux protein (plasmid) [Trichormus variabilis NIES-23]|uniref:Antibiotic efflux protein n=1 Tax=Trichormus variabilis NIES-23 TaxID=1973479 RepID=A0A1Z4KX46_ANAVA|nr:antibiotic efflux protein [Trichormus variabilis NIES-23]
MWIKNELKRQVNFLALWLASTVSNLGDGLFKWGLPIIATKLTSSPGLVAGLTFALTLSWLLFAIPAGIIVDRIDRRQLMIRASWIRAMIVCISAVAVAMDYFALPVLYLSASLFGICETLVDTAAISIVPSVVPSKKLEWANTLIMSGQTVTNEFIGPLLAGTLTAISITLTLGSSCIAYLIAAISLIFIRGSFKSTRLKYGSVITDIFEGFQLFWHQKLLRTIALLAALMAGCWSAWSSILVVYIITPGPVGLSEFGYGLLVTVLAIGGIIGSILVIPTQRILGRRKILLISFVTMSLMLVTPSVTTNTWIIAATMLLGGIGSTMWNILVYSLRQHLIPSAFLGRFTGVSKFITRGSLPLGSAIAGIIAEIANVRMVFIFSGVISILSVILFLKLITTEALDEAEKQICLS